MSDQAVAYWILTLSLLVKRQSLNTLGRTLRQRNLQPGVYGRLRDVLAAKDR
jgi:hypothetical protein